ncbi:hypothetical protein [Nocardia beijingensis]
MTDNTTLETSTEDVLPADVHRYANLAALFHTGGTTGVPRLARACRRPQDGSILDSPPVTDVGKPCKLGLRADATRRELLYALAETTGVAGISAAVEDGAVVATVVLDSGADPAAAEAILGRYAIDARVGVRQ